MNWSTTGWIWAIIIAIVIIGGGYLLLTSPNTSGVPGAATGTLQGATSSTQGTAATTSTTGAPTGGEAQTVTVTYDGASFSPSNVTIPVGGTVRFVSTAGNIWVASDEHPTHTEYDGSTRQSHCAATYMGPAPFDQCSGGKEFSYTFTKAGTWEYHNHLNASQTGTVTVEAQ